MDSQDHVLIAQDMLGRTVVDGHDQPNIVTALCACAHALLAINTSLDLLREQLLWQGGDTS